MTAPIADRASRADPSAAIHTAMATDPSMVRSGSDAGVDTAMSSGNACRICAPTTSGAVVPIQNRVGSSGSATVWSWIDWMTERSTRTATASGADGIPAATPHATTGTGSLLGVTLIPNRVPRSIPNRFTKPVETMARIGPAG